MGLTRQVLACVPAAGRPVGVSVVAVACCSALLAACGTGKRTTPPAGASAHAKGVRLVRIGRFDHPIYVTGAPGDRKRLFVVEKSGVIVVLINGHRRSRPFLDISKVVNSSGGEQGLLSLAFAPDYQRSGRFYVDYTASHNDVHVVQYRVDLHNPDMANAGSARSVLTIEHRQYNNHNGGQLQFGPDGDLYIGVGDGGSEGDPMNNGQNTDALLGKLLRIRPLAHGGYTVPKTNPFVGQSGKQPAIWAYGLRNPWRFSFDRLTGALVIADVGQDREEEVDYAARGTGSGANYGWSIWEGDLRYKQGKAHHAISPVLVTKHSQGYCAIIGGYVVRDHALRSLYGRYVYGDLCRPQINSAKLSEGRATGRRAIGLSVNNLSSFGEDTLGRIYAVSLDGPIYRIAER